MYFEEPVQVIFADPDATGCWISGIAYRDEIICACCGGVFDISEILEIAAEDNIENPIHSFGLDWVDLSPTICEGHSGRVLRIDSDTLATAVEPLF